LGCQPRNSETLSGSEMNVISESLTKTQCFAAQFETLKNTIHREGKFGEVP